MDQRHQFKDLNSIRMDKSTGYDPILCTEIIGEGLDRLGLVCSICLLIPKDPVKTKSLKNSIYCRECLLQCENDPVSRRPLNSSDIENVENMIKSQIDNLIVQCPFESEGCKWKN